MCESISSAIPCEYGTATQKLAPAGILFQTGVKSKLASTLADSSFNATKLCQPSLPISKRTPAKEGINRW
ncbi:Uncharacterised protein [Shigella flexneri]|nr:Uncharacterised protein [Shigella flexneri]